jgi:hypothetical protein
MLTIPPDGLDEISGIWIGRGQLHDAVEVSLGQDADWAASDFRARAARVLLEIAALEVASWPAAQSSWREIVPIESGSDRLTQKAPAGRVDWAATRQGSGWPPTEFQCHKRFRLEDSIALQVLRWVVATLNEAVLDLQSAVVESPDFPYDRLRIAADYLASTSGWSDSPRPPLISEIRPLRFDGFPWVSVSKLAAMLRLADSDPFRFARVHLMPDAEFASALFELATLGLVLRDFRARGAKVVSLKPLGSRRPGPCARVLTPTDGEVEVWFNTAGVWRAVGIRTAYSRLSSSVLAARSSPIPDIVLLRPEDSSAFIVECKYSDSASYVMSGVQQIMSYMAEFLEGGRWSVAGLVVTPSEVVKSSAVVQSALGTVGVTGADRISEHARWPFANQSGILPSG